MKQSWKMVKLGEVLNHRKGFIQIDDLEKYKLCRVQTSARGIVLRSEVLGSEIRTKKQQVCKAGDFLVAEIDAKMGGYGIVPEDLEGAIVSSHYFLYDIIEDKLDKTYLEFFSQTPRFFKQVKAEGSTNYAAIRPSHVLTYEIPLPPLSEQQRIAGRLAALKEKIDAVRALRGEQEKEMKGLKNAVYLKAENDVEPKPLGDFLKKSESRIEPMMGTAYRQVGVKWWGEGAYERETIDGGQTAYKSFCRLELNDFIFNKIWVRHGALAIVKDNTVGCYAPGEFPVFKCKSDLLAPQWLDFIINSPLFWEKCAALSKGTSGKNRIKPEQLLGIKIPVPSISEQERLTTMLKKMDALKSAQAEQLSALEGLFPGVLEQAFRGEW